MSSSLRSERNKALYKLWDLIFLVRPPLLCASCVFFFSGVAASKSSSIISSTKEVGRALSNLILFVLITSIAFVVNQILDVESDRLNKKVFIMPLNLIRRSEAVVFALVLILTVIALSYRRALPEVALVWSGVGLGVLYSLPPVRLKSIPIADVTSNSIGFGWIGFTLGWLSLAPLDRHALVLSSAYAIGMAGIFLNTLIEDEDGDRIVGDKTTCVALGRRKVAIGAFVSILVAAVIALLEGHGLLWVGAFGSIPVFVGILSEPSKEASAIASRVTAWIFLLLVGLKVPIYLVMAFGVFVLSRIYYRSRFSLIYPTLG